MAVFRFRIFTRQISSRSYNHSQSDCLCNVAHGNQPSVSRPFALHDNESDPCWDCLGLAYETNLTLLTSHHTLPHHTLPPPFPVLHLTSPLHHRAQSGTGKTATFSISMLQKVDIQLREVQTLVLSPTRELAVQIQKVTIPNGMEWKEVKC